MVFTGYAIMGVCWGSLRFPLQLCGDATAHSLSKRADESPFLLSGECWVVSWVAANPNFGTVFVFFLFGYAWGSSPFVTQ